MVADLHRQLSFERTGCKFVGRVELDREAGGVIRRGVDAQAGVELCTAFILQRGAGDHESFLRILDENYKNHTVNVGIGSLERDSHILADNLRTRRRLQCRDPRELHLAGQLVPIERPVAFQAFATRGRQCAGRQIKSLCSFCSNGESYLLAAGSVQAWNAAR